MNWNSELANIDGKSNFLNVHLSDLESEYLTVSPEALIGKSTKPQFYFSIYDA